MKKNNSKLLFSILIPSASVVGLTAIVVPLVCLTTQEVHITRKTEERRHFPNLNELNDIKFTFTLTDENVDLNNLSCTWGYTISSMRNCAVSDINLESVDQTTFLVHLALVSTDGHKIELGDSISFDFHFVYSNNNEVVWKQDILNNYIKVTNEVYD